MLACVALTIPGLNLLAGGVKSKFLCGVLGTLLLEFIAGLVAWRLHLYWFLKAYPFRVADVLVWFLCCLLLPTILVSFLQRTGIGERMDFTIQPRMALICTVALLVLVAIPLAIRYQQGRLHALRFSPSSSRTTPYLEMTQWIRSNTPAGAIFVAPPWLMDFFLDAERAEVVNFKRNPHNFLIVEWYRRYCAMNGGQPFHSTGFESVEETRANFPRLSLAQLDEIHRLYGGNYYLTVQGRDDLGAPPVHENAQFYLYKLR